MNLDAMLNDYADWIRNEITTARFGEYLQITSPYLDHFNDYVQIYVKMNSDGTIDITDDGYTLNNLAMSGVSLNRSPARRTQVSKIARTFGVAINGDELITHATIEDFPQKKHLFIQAMLRIDDMFSLAENNVQEYFNDDVKDFFDKNGIYYSENLSLVGKTGGVHQYDFHFQRSKNKPQRFCRTINRLNKTSRNAAIFSWTDTMDVHGSDSELLVIINDDNSVKGSDITAFKNYSIKPINYSQLGQNLEEFYA